jgi:hypothetical protein
MHHRLAAALLLPLLLLSCLPPPPPAAPPALLQGRLTLDGKGTARVAAALIAAGDPRGPAAPPAATTVSDAEGRFSLSVPAGSYFLTAASGDYAGYDGRNPLALPPGRVTAVTVPLVEDPGPPSTAPDGVITGRVLLAGSAVEGILVTAYADALGHLRGPGVASATTGPDGAFTLDLGPGTYFLLARGRRSPGGTGPLSPGDRFAYYPRNPVTLGEGQGASILLTAVVIPEHPPGSAAGVTTAIVVSGRVMDGAGRPVAGYHACAFDNAGQINRPLAFSAATGPDGKFTMELPGPGTYYLGARPRLGGPLAPGEIPAWYRDGDPVEVAWGDRLEGVAIILGDPLP